MKFFVIALILIIDGVIGNPQAWGSAGGGGRASGSAGGGGSASLGGSAGGSAGGSLGGSAGGSAGGSLGGLASGSPGGSAGGSAGGSLGGLASGSPGGAADGSMGGGASAGGSLQFGGCSIGGSANGQIGGGASGSADGQAGGSASGDASLGASAECSPSADATTPAAPTFFPTVLDVVKTVQFEPNEPNKYVRIQDGSKDSVVIYLKRVDADTSITCEGTTSLDDKDINVDDRKNPVKICAEHEPGSFESLIQNIWFAGFTPGRRCPIEPRVYPCPHDLPLIFMNYTEKPKCGNYRWYGNCNDVDDEWIGKFNFEWTLKGDECDPATTAT